MKQPEKKQARLKELLKLKRRLLDRMRKHRKALAKDRDTKKAVNDEIKKLRKSGNAFDGMTEEEAKAKVSREIKGVEPKDIFPADLEKQFDKLERTSSVKFRSDSVDISDIEDDDGPVATRSRVSDSEDGLHSVMVDPNEVVMDFSGDLDEDYYTGPVNEDGE